MELEMEIVSTTPNFNFKGISLADPEPLIGQAGFYFTQLSINTPLSIGEEEKKALCLQLPECLTKQGVVNIKNGKYLDLMFERSSNDELMRWIEQLEYTCQDIIDSKKELWFQTELTRDDIETMMTQVTRLYQSGKYMLMRVFIDTSKKCIAYDENEIGFDLDILEPNKPVIPLIMIEGVKFSSRSFEISLKLVQVMVIGKSEKKSSCLIKRQQDIDQIKEEPIVAKPEPIIEKPIVVEKPILVEKPIVVAKPIAKPIVVEKPIEKSIVAKPIVAKQAIIPEKREIEEITIDYSKVEKESISLKDPNEVYYELYRKAREKAKQCRTAAIEAYLEAKQIKKKYMLFEEDDSDDDMSEDDTSEDEN